MQALHGCLNGVGATGDSELAVAQGRPAGGADGEGVEVGPAGVPEHDGLGPGLQWRSPHSFRASRIGWSSRPAWGEQVLIARRVLAAPSALDHAGQLQLAQPDGEHVAGAPVPAAMSWKRVCPWRSSRATSRPERSPAIARASVMEPTLRVGLLWGLTVLYPDL
jgi:hypothetical protein